MILHEAQFKKKNDEVRLMRFIKLSDLDPTFLTSLIKGKQGEKIKNSIPGTELVWDYDKNDFRIFNWNTVIGKVKESVIERLKETT